MAYLLSTNEVAMDGPDGQPVISRGRAVTVWMDARFPFVHVYTSRAGVAIEPATCAPDAFNSGDGLLVLVPGGSWSGQWGLNTQREVQ